MREEGGGTKTKKERERERESYIVEENLMD